MGPKTLWTARVTRIDCRDLRTLGDVGSAEMEERIVQAFTAMRRELPGDAVLFFTSIPEDLTSNLTFARLAASPDGYRAPRWGQAYKHRYAAISGGLNEYLKRLGSKTRADLRPTRRRFEQHAGSSSELFIAQSEPDIEGLADTILKVAPNTWQHKKIRVF